MKTLYSYILGFVLSVVLTLIAFGVVEQHLITQHVVPPHKIIVPILVTLALIQLLVQLVCFLHLGKKENSGWNIMTFVFALFIVVTFVGGSLWIMNHLNHSMQHIEFKGGIVAPQTHDD